MISSSSGGTSRLMLLALAGSGLLVVAGVAAFWYASTVAHKPSANDGHAVTVTIEGNTCQPNEITIPAGRTTFTIVNHSTRALEWEILDGVMVVEERENIAPGFSQTMTAKLSPGDFDITCGLLSNPRGKLHVTPSAASDAEAARPSLVNYVGPLAEYRVFLVTESQTLQDAVTQLDAAIQANDLAQSQSLYLQAHQSYKRLEPMAELFADLDTRLNARADYFEKRQEDPAFGGFHRIANALYVAHDAASAKAASTRMVGDVDALAGRLGGLAVPPERLAGAAARLLRRVADNLPADGQDQDGQAELSSLQGTLDGTRQIYDLLVPLLVKAKPALDQTLQQCFAAFDAALAPYRDGEDYRKVTLDAAQRQALAAPIRALADGMDQINAGLGLE